MATSSNANHDAARVLCKHYVDSYDDLPGAGESRPRAPMFRQAPPPHLSQEESDRYDDNYSILVETLLAAPTGKRSQADKKSRARLQLWELWSTSLARHEAQSAAASSSSTAQVTGPQSQQGVEDAGQPADGEEEPANGEEEDSPSDEGEYYIDFDAAVARNPESVIGSRFTPINRPPTPMEERIALAREQCRRPRR
ncbi:MAG: hypothetical protein Q9191_005178 [Dirinaria sp. TL-2023a]